jgi:hypothetical protein
MGRARDLDLYLTEVQARAFDWAAWNCCHFTAMWVQRVTGRDVLAGLPPMHSRLTAHRVISQLGGSLQAAWTRQIGRDSILPTLAQVGDVVLVRVDDVEAVGICCGRTAAVLTEAQGVAHVPMSAALAAWWVGA